MADESTHSSDDITTQVASSHIATEEAVDAIARAAGGAQGLSELAEALHRDIAGFAQV